MSEWYCGFHEGACGAPVLPTEGAEHTGGQSAEWWQGRRRGADVRRAAAPAIWRAYVRLGFILSALTAEEVEAA